MRITLLIRDLGYAGAQRQLVALAKGLHQRRDQVCVCTFYGGPMQAELEGAGVKVVCFGKRHRWDMLGFLWRAASGLRGSKPEVLYSFLNESNVLAALMRPLLRDTRLVWGLRDSETDAALYGWLGKLAFKLGKGLSAVPEVIIANSHSGARYYTDQGYPKEKIQVVPNGIDTERFMPDDAARQRVRAELQVRPEETLFGMIGRLSPMKDYATFLKAAAQVPDARFLCVGTGGEAYTQQMHSLADELRVKVIWSAPREDMPAVFNALDVLVSSSAFGEGFSNVTGEAMACGTPCLVTDVGDSALLVGDTGLVVPPKNADALAAAMSKFMARDKSGSPRQRIVENFTVPQMIESTVCLIQPPASSLKPQATKLLFITTALGSGGAEMMLTQLITHLDRARFEPYVISLTDGGKHVGTLQAAGVPVQSLGMSAGRPSLRSLVKLRQHAKQFSPDLIIGWMYHGNLAATLASWIGKRAPVLWNVRQSLYSLALEKRGSALVIKALAWLGFHPQHILYNSRVSAQQHEAIGYPEAKRVLVPNGFDTVRFQPDAEARASVRAELGLPTDAILIGRFGRNSAMKDYATFIEAMKSVPNAVAIIAGTGTAELEPLILQPSSIIILDERQDLSRLTAALDIACSSSAFGEGFPNVVAEAMCCGIPCVVTDVGDSAWLLNGGGTVVPPKNAAALAEALNCMVALTPEQRRALGEMGRQRILDHFALPAVVHQFESLFSPHPSPFIPHPSIPCAA